MAFVEREVVTGHISSPQNPRVKDWVRLLESKHRRRQKRFLIEGRREIERAAQAGWAIQHLLWSSEWVLPEELELWVRSMAALHKVPPVELAGAVFRKLSLRENPDGLIAIASYRERNLAELDCETSRNPLLLLLEGLEKPGNLGAIFRTADAAGVQAVLLCDQAGDPLSPHAIRASQGAVFSVPFVRTSCEEAADWLVAKECQLLATTPDAKRCLWEADVRTSTCFLFGTEADGLSPFWLNHSRATTVKLPMQGQADSLNVAATAAIALFEAVRQRREG
jgi:RNA methyltransferase, TrmH family